MKKLILPVLLFIGSITISFSQITIPYYNDFETDTVGWYNVSTSGGSFQWDSIGSSNCTGNMGLNFGFTNTGGAMLYSPTFSLNGISNIVICISHKYVSALNNNGTRIDYSFDGIIWDVLGSTTQGYNWYNGSSINSSNLPAWTGSSLTCINSSISMNNINGFYSIQFRFVPTHLTSTNQYFLDDFRICLPGCSCGSLLGTETLEGDLESFSIFPNPASGRITILSKTDLPYDVSIVSATGKKIISNMLFSQNKDISIENLESGIYFLRLVNSKVILNKKFIVNNP